MKNEWNKNKVRMGERAESVDKHYCIELVKCEGERGQSANSCFEILGLIIYRY